MQAANPSRTPATSQPDYTLREAAELLGIPVATLRKRAQRPNAPTGLITIPAGKGRAARITHVELERAFPDHPALRRGDSLEELRDTMIRLANEAVEADVRAEQAQQNANVAAQAAEAALQAHLEAARAFQAARHERTRTIDEWARDLNALDAPPE